MIKMLKILIRGIESWSTFLKKQSAWDRIVRQCKGGTLWLQLFKDMLCNSVFFNTFLAKNLSQTDWQNLNWLRFLSYSKIVLRFFIYCAKIMLRVFHMLRFLRYFIRLILASKQGNHLDNYSNLKKKSRCARLWIIAI